VPTFFVFLSVGKQDEDIQNHHDSSGYDVLHHGCYSTGVVVLYCTAPKNGILIAAPTRKMKNFKMEYSVKSLPSLPTGRLDDTQLNWSVTADDDDHVHSSDVSRKRAYRVRLGSQTMMAVTDHGVDVSRPSHCALVKAAAPAALRGKHDHG
jgi:hypothetical protein